MGLGSLRLSAHWMLVWVFAAWTVRASAQTVQVVPLLPSAAPGVATGPGTVTITGAGGQGKGTVTASLPASVPVIPCPGSPNSKCLGPATVHISHTLAGFGRFIISTSDDGLKPTRIGNIDVYQCSVSEGIGASSTPAPKEFDCQFLYLPYIESGTPWTTSVRFDINTTNDSFADANYIVRFQWGPVTSCPAPTTRTASTVEPRRADCGIDLAIDHIQIVQTIQDPSNSVELLRGREAFVRVFLTAAGQLPKLPNDEGITYRVKGEVLLNGDPLRPLRRLRRKFEFLDKITTEDLTPPSLDMAQPYAGYRSLDYRVSEGQMRSAAGAINVTARVWMEDQNKAEVPEADKSNNSKQATVPLRAENHWPETYVFGVVPLCVTIAGVAACPDKTPVEPLSDQLPLPNTIVQSPEMPDLTIPVDALNSPEGMTKVMQAGLAEYLKAVRLASEKPREADFLVFAVYGNEFTDKNADTYFGQIGGLGNVWLVRTSTFGAGAIQQLLHGIGHSTGLTHYVQPESGDKVKSPLDPDPYTAWGWSTFEARTIKDDEIEGNNPERRTTNANTLMAGKPGVWVSKGEYLFFGRSGPYQEAKELQRRNADPVFSGEVLVITGTVARDGLTGMLDPGFRGPSTVAPPGSQAGGDTCLRFFAGGTAAGDHCFTVRFTEGVSLGYFAVSPAYPAGADRVVLIRGGRELASLRTGTPPAVTITSPTGGETWQGMHKIQWTATGASPVYTVQYSADDGASWRPLSPTLTASEFEFNTANIIGGEKVRFRVLTTVGLDTAAATSQSVRVPQNAVLTLSAAELQFPNLTVGESWSLDLVATNTGTGRIKAAISTPGNAAFTVDGPASTVLGAGEKLTLRVRFAPATGGAQQGTFQIGDKAVTLRGSGFTSPVASIGAPAQVDMGQVQIGTVKEVPVLIANDGVANLTVTSVTASGTGFSAAAGLPVSLKPGDTVEVVVRLAGAANGVQTGQLFVASSDPTRPQTVVLLTAEGVAGSVPVATAAGVVHAASFQGGAIAPGEIITVYGTNVGPPAITTLQLDERGKVATQVAGTRFLFDGVPAPIVYVLAGQSSIVVPYSVAGKSSTQMVVEYQGRRSDPVTLAVTSAAPGLFSANSSGTGPGAILNQDNSVNTPQNPAQKGSVIILYGTGEGLVSPSHEDGNVVGALHEVYTRPVAATIGGVNAKVTFAGSAPNLVAGVLQVNLEVPASVASGNQPVVVTIGEVSSQAGLTVAIAGAPTTAPTIAIEPVSLDFGTVNVGQTATRMLTLRNTGGAPLNVTFLFSSNAVFQPVEPLAPFTIQASQTRTMTLRFAPTAAGAQSGSFTISSNDPARPSVAVAVSGVGAANSQTPGFAVEPSSLDFGTVSVNQTKDLTLTIRNTGTATLTISGIAGTSARFTPVGVITVPFSVNPGATRSLTFRFSPIAVGPQAGTIVISSNDPARPSITVPVSGTGGGFPAITFGQTINGTLSASSGRSVNCGTCFADTYQLTVAATRMVDIRLNSNAFDAYLQILDAAGMVLHEDDDTGGGFNSRIVVSLPAGTYRIEASSVNDGESGAYALSIAP